MAYKELYLGANVDDNDIWILDYTTTANIQYFGYARPGTATSSPSWKIYVIDLDPGGSGIPIGKRFAGGTPAYVGVWDNRTLYTYS